MPFGDVPLPLLERYAAGVCTAEELAALEEWIGGDPQRRLIVESLRSVFADRADAPVPSEGDIERAWESLAERMGVGEGTRRRPFARPVLTATILVVCVAVLGVVWYLLAHQPP